MSLRNICFLSLFLVLAAACRKNTKLVVQESHKVTAPLFSADSAYAYIKAQVDFGARVPNTKSHKTCATYLSNTLKRFGVDVIEQKTNITAYDGTILESVNIIGQINPNVKSRVLLCSHWDSRPWADNDPNPKNHKKPVMGANDGASGVGILLELARLMAKQSPEIGVDIVFLDAEDYGQTDANNEDSWCLGTQYWSKNPHKKDYTARYGILLDMVGSPNATFYREHYSQYYASSIVNLVWSKASELGFSNIFKDSIGGTITDDHLVINKLARIPCIDIIDFNPNSSTGFGSYWHTINDTMENIDKNTLNAVGVTLLQVIYAEKKL